MAVQAPPFAGLRTLEAACRLRSYSAAGEELGVTHSAVSQTVRRLEIAHAQKLFLRQGSQMAPTPAALALAEAYLEAAGIVERAADRLSRAAAAPTLVLSTLPSFAKLWFSPRLKRLREALPDIMIDVRTTRELANLETDGVDVAIRIGGGPWPRLHAETLYEDAAFVACSPEFLARHGPFTDQRIAEAPLILEDDDMWAAWFTAAGVAPPAARKGLAFDDAAMVLEAAASGLGVALVRRAYAESALDGGRLVRISDVEARDGRSCHMLWRDDNPRIAAIYRFADWLLSECQSSGLLEAA
jgi:LysR family transcriptional regulator, glycine cleavage system transcriptional activator